MGTVYVFFADGFEEIEAFTSVDVMRRAGLNVEMVTVTPDEIVIYYVSGVPNLSFPDSGICLCHAPHSCKAYIHRNLSDHNKASSDKHKDE